MYFHQKKEIISTALHFKVCHDIYIFGFQSILNSFWGLDLILKYIQKKTGSEEQWTEYWMFTISSLTMLIEMDKASYFGGTWAFSH